MSLPELWPVLAIAIPTAVGYGELRVRVAGVRRDTDEKATKDIVYAQYREIISRLDRIEDRIENRVKRDVEAA